MKKWIFACLPLLFAAACEDEIDHSGEVHATAVELYSVGVTTAVFDAEIYGNGVTERGICWAEEENPTPEDFSVKDSGTGAGPFTAQLTGLEPSTTYYVRAYAIAGADIYYSSQFDFTTYDELTATISSATASMNYIVAEFTVAGGAEGWAVSDCGVAYGTAANPTVSGSKVAAATPDFGNFSVTINGLNEGTVYYLRPYVVYNDGVENTTVYGEQTSVTTLTAAQLQQLFVDRLEALNLTYGSVYRNSSFAMHYDLDLDAMQVTVTYIEASESKDAKHVTVPMAYNDDFSKLEWSAVVNGDVEFSGIGLDGATFNLYPLGAEGMQLQAPMSESDIYSIFVPKSYGGIDRVSELKRGNLHPSIPESIFDAAGMTLEYSGSTGGLITAPFSKAYFLFKNKTDNTGKPIIPVTKEVAVFSFGEYTYPYGGSLSDDEVAQTEDGMKPLTDFLYDADGLIIVKATINTATPTDGDFYYYMISSTGEKWVMWYLRANGK